MQYNTNLLYRTMANRYIVYPCIYTHRSSHIRFVHYCTPYIFRHYCTALQHDSCTLRLYLKTVYILGEQHTVHIILTVHSTRMKMQMHSTLLYGAGAAQKVATPDLNEKFYFTDSSHCCIYCLYHTDSQFTMGYFVHYIYVAFRYKTQVPCTVSVYIG